jgi:predicted RNA-binding Zn ribbon-like protein
MKRPPRYDVPNAAPGPLRTVQLFVNTSNHETGLELLGSADALAEWLATTGADVDSATRADLRRAHALRSALRGAIATGVPGPAFEEAARRSKLTVAFPGPTLAAQAAGVDGALGAMVATVYEAMRDGSWSRLKTCRNCEWAYWDNSKNRSAAWCSMQLCGSRAKVRRYRSRARQVSA